MRRTSRSGLDRLCCKVALGRNNRRCRRAENLSFAMLPRVLSRLPELNALADSHPAALDLAASILHAFSSTKDRLVLGFQYFQTNCLLVQSPEALTMADAEVCSQALASMTRAAAHPADWRPLCPVRRCATRPSRKSWTPKHSCRALGSSGLHVGRLGRLRRGLGLSEGWLLWYAFCLSMNRPALRSSTRGPGTCFVQLGGAWLCVTAPPHQCAN